MKPAKISSYKKVIFRFLLILIPVFFFMSLELFLRIINFGFSTELLVPVESNGQFLTISPDLGRKYFPNKRISPFVTPDFLLKDKPENSYRIFVFGGSTAAGYPYHFNARFSVILKNLLQSY